MTLEEIRELIQVVVESGIAELEVQRGESRVRIRASGVNHDIVVSAAVPPQAAAAAASSAPHLVAPASQQASAAVQPAAADVASDPSLVIVKSPIVGTYYESPSPSAPPFVKVGDTVKAGQVLCIIESMKLMNEIEAETAGVIVSKLVETGHPVEYGEALFALRPL
ncbi:MAG: acetyl-CoA carboxylase biotin carboxyl carrier protein [Bryobacteraceae bacterium]